MLKLHVHVARNCACILIRVLACSPYAVSEKRSAVDFGTVELSAMGDPARIPTLYLAVSNESSIDTWLTFAADLFATRATRASVVKKFAHTRTLVVSKLLLALYE